LISKFVFTPNTIKSDTVTVTPKNNNSNNEFVKNTPTKNEGNYQANENIPQKVYEVLKYVKANNQAMDGYVGGREFTNREKVLPLTNANGERIKYQEWDVNPKVQGQNRGTQRMCTGDDGRSWYTSDHYKSFTEIK
jgi:ribonuclease T1